MFVQSRMWFRCLLIGSLAAVWGCGPGQIGGGDPAPVGNPRGLVFCENTEAPVPNCLFGNFDVREKLEGCAGDPLVGGCHAGVDRPTNMEIDLSDPLDTPESVLGTYVNEGATLCGGDMLIDLNNIDCSLILTKVTDKPSCGQQMPVAANEHWDDDDIDCFRKWLHDTYGN